MADHDQNHDQNHDIINKKDIFMWLYTLYKGYGQGLYVKADFL